MSRLSFPVPRAIYYMHPVTAFKSLFSLTGIKKQPTVVRSFEAAFAQSVDCSYGVATSHARIAFYAILKSLNLPNGCEILMTAINLPDMVNMVLLNKCQPICVDQKEKSFNISIDDLQKKTTSKTKVLFLTVLAGIQPNLDEIYDFAKKNNLIVIQDLTQAYGLTASQGKNIAAYADFSIYSLCDLKDIHTHRGGMIVTQNSSPYLKLKTVIQEISTQPNLKYFLKFILEDMISALILRRLFFSIFVYPVLKILYRSNQIENVTNLTKGKGFTLFSLNIGRGLWGGNGDLIRQTIPEELRYNFTDHQAQIGLQRLKSARSIMLRRKENAQRLIEKINSRLLPFDPNQEHSFWKFPILVSDIKKWQKELFKYGIDAAPTNLPLLSRIECFKSLLQGELQDAHVMTDHILYVPLHYYLKPHEVDFIAQTINAVAAQIEAL